MTWPRWGSCSLAVKRAPEGRSQAADRDLLCDSQAHIFGLGQTLATTLVGLATRIAAKMTAYTYALLINRIMGRPQGRIKELWA